LQFYSSEYFVYTSTDHEIADKDEENEIINQSAVLKLNL